MKSQQYVDLRSDTVTLPTKEMLEAILETKLGDDVYGEDPTVNQLEEMAAEKMGKEAALLVTSGTQANLISLMSNCKRGDQVILESESHINWYEVGGVSSIAGLFPWPIKTDGGAFKTEELEASIRPKNIHYPELSLVCVENTHNRHGGTILTPNQLEAISKVTKKHSVRLYMDGARIFNAAVALGLDPKEFSKHVDNLMFCLSKGLACPVGSLIVGDQEFIEKARKVRKLLGGGMRQAGIIAAPGIVALKKMVSRLRTDHENAKLLAEKLSRIDGVQIDAKKIQTNIVIFDLVNQNMKSDEFINELERDGILALTQGEKRVRIVTHWGIEKEHIERTASAIERILTQPQCR